MLTRQALYLRIHFSSPFLYISKYDIILTRTELSTPEVSFALFTLSCCLCLILRSVAFSSTMALERKSSTLTCLEAVFIHPKTVTCSHIEGHMFPPLVLSTLFPWGCAMLNSSWVSSVLLHLIICLNEAHVNQKCVFLLCMVYEAIGVTPNLSKGVFPDHWSLILHTQIPR